VVVREHKELSKSIILGADGNPREETTHRGTVVALGAPVRGEWGFGVGDVVQFHYSATETGRTVHDGLVVMAQHEIDAVIET
jgi:co-chaperonin GroES (HSP10)